MNKLVQKTLRLNSDNPFSKFDLLVEWKFLGGEMQCRHIINWNTETKEYMHLVTNLSRTEFSAEQIVLAYKLRWQVELLFKEWKSYANLKKFDTSNAYIAEGLIRAGLAAAIINDLLYILLSI